MKRLALALSLVLLTSATAFAGPGDGDLVNILKNASTRDQLALPVEKLSEINNLFAKMEKQIADALNKVKPEIKVGGFRSVQHGRKAPRRISKANRETA
jgi:hypothetical protein